MQKLACPIASDYQRSTPFDIVMAMSCFAGMIYGILAYINPNFFFGPHSSVFPSFVQTSMESNDLDPITTHMMRLEGVSVISIILCYYLFDFGRVEYERAALKGFLVGHVATAIVLFTEIKGEATTEYYIKEALPSTLVWSTCHTFLLTYALAKLPKSPKKQGAVKKGSSRPSFSVPPDIDSAIFYACALVVALTCTKGFRGPDPAVFPVTPLKDNSYDPIMILEAKTVAAWYMPQIYHLLFSSQTMPGVTYKAMSVSIILTLPVLALALHDEIGNVRAFEAMICSCIGLLAVSLYRLRELTSKKTALDNDFTDGMHLRDGRVISYKSQ